MSKFSSAVLFLISLAVFYKTNSSAVTAWAGAFMVVFGAWCGKLVSDTIFDEERAEIRYKEEQELKKQKEEAEAFAFKKQLELFEQQKTIDEKISFFNSKEQAFSESFLKGREWLAFMIAEIEQRKDMLCVEYLLNKKNPAPKKASEIEKIIKGEKRSLQYRVKFLEAQLASYEEYFPFIEEYRDDILNEELGISDNEIDEECDNILNFISQSEYEKLSVDERNQLALDRYTGKSHSKRIIGLFYERFIGWTFEKDGWQVEYYGALHGLEDRGIDLICKKGKHARLIQCKYWSKKKEIHEKHIFQLYGVIQAMYYDGEIDKEYTDAEIITNINLSNFAELMADTLGIKYSQNREMDKDYPKIKCTITESGEKIYHLPFDQQYDRINMNKDPRRFYAKTVAEAVAKGHRRAFRYQFGREY